MTRTLVRTLLTASLIFGAWASTSDACHRRRAAASATCYGGYSGYPTPSPTGYYDATGGYATPTAYPAGYPAGGYGYPGSGYGYGGGYGYDFGRPGYNPGGLGGPMSGFGVRPGMGFGGFGLGR